MPTTYAIPNGATVMDATLYTGSNATATIVNAGAFKPDLIWLKLRSSISRNTLFDSVRGNTKVVWSDSTDAEGTATAGTGLNSFNTNGFTLGTEIAGTSGSTNFNGSTYVGWQWQAGQGSTSSNTSGSITSTVSANTTAGFSIATYTGTGANATVGHGLGVAPSWVIVKARGTVSGGGDWCVWHSGLTSGAYSLFLNTTNAQSSFPTVWNSTIPTSSVFSIGTADSTNKLSTTFVAYCWTPIAGFSQFGSYTGNGSADGPFVYLGFRPKFVLFKNVTTAGSDWAILDSVRNTSNLETLILNPNSSAAESTSATFADYLSNGFKMRSSSANTNANTIIYAAFAENPFKYANAR